MRALFLGIDMRLRLSLCSICVLASTCLAMTFIYAQFIVNPAVFDDLGIFGNLGIFDLAQSSTFLSTRSLPYFLIGFFHVLSDGNLIWNRWFNIALFALSVVALYFFLLRSMARAPDSQTIELRWAILCTCLWFALNPVAVYAVAYLIQRTILMAALFSIVAATLYLRAQQQDRNPDILSAALFTSLAMICKEHAVLLPVAILALTPLAHAWNRIVTIRAASFLLILVPICYWTISHRSNLVGTNYEIYAGEVLSQMTPPSIFDFAGGTWVMSIATQLGLFLRYAFLWFVPNPSFLSADIRIDFPAYWQGIWGFLGVATVLAAGLLSLRITIKKEVSPMLRIGAAAFLYAAILYGVEFSVVRVQEPFVLYRSFLWAPAYALVLCGLLLACSSWLRARNHKVWLTFCIAVPLACLAMIPWTQDRLQSFSSEEAIWQDALQKLPSPTVAGADRIYYNLAGEAYKAKRFEEALKFSELVIKQNPQSFQGYLAKGTSLLALSDAVGASQAFDEASVRPSPPEFAGYIQYKRCIVLEVRGNTAAIPDCLRLSAKMGYGQADFRLKMMGLQ